LRTKINVQPEFDFEPSHLKVTNEYYAKYEEISTLLDAHPRIVDLVHHDLQESLQALNKQGKAQKGGSTFTYTSDTVLRVLLCQVIENLSLRGVVVRVDDSHFLRRFVRIYSGPMLDFTTLCNLKNAISGDRWKQINEALARGAIEKNLISGEALRLDTTAVETHIHWPTDSSLLWDTYRVLARLIERARQIDPASTDSKRPGSKRPGSKRLLTRKAKKLQTKIARKASKNARLSETVKSLYSSLIGLVYRLCEGSADVAAHLEQGIVRGRYDVMSSAFAQAIIDQMAHYRELGARVMDQTQRRVFNEEKVPNDEKLFSIFEPHTELLKRGKAGKPIEFGHMVEIEQVAQKFITNYAVYEHKPVEHQLVGPALDHHKNLFGHDPEWLAADKGYYLTEQMEALRERVEVVSIAKKGKRTEEETEREKDPLFRHAQRFRAGIEGTISFLKRILGMFRCHNKTWEHYEATIGLTVLAHNLLTLSRW